MKSREFLLLLTILICACHANNPPDYLFKGISNTGWNPPDPVISVGIDRLVVAVNGGLVIYDKVNPGSNFYDYKTLNSFFSGSNVFDPRTVYDFDENRFIVVCVDGAGDGNTIVIATSKTAYPANLSLTHWRIDKINMRNSGESGWCDYPMLGIDNYNIYINCNMFGSSTGGRMWIIKKASIYGNSSIVYTWPYSLLFSTQPVVNYDTPNKENYLVSATNFGFRLYKVNNVEFSKPIVTPFDISFNVPRRSPPGALQRGGGNRIATNDARLLNAVKYNGLIYVTHQHSDSSGSLSVVSWYVIDPLSNRIIAVETVTGNGEFNYFPCVAVNQDGTVGAIMSTSSSNTFTSMKYVYKKQNESQKFDVVKGGTSYYLGSRYGDYAGCTIDPQEKNRFWFASEVASGTLSWDVWVYSTCPDCESECSGSCDNGVCINGECICNEGFEGDSCDSCARNYYGINCLPCSCAEDEVCDDTDGTCFKLECTSNLDCNFRPGGVATGGLCIVGGKCFCYNGWYGVDCSQRCPDCVHGECLSGGFFDKNQGICECFEEQNYTFNTTTRDCRGCLDGYYGEECKECPRCKPNEVCDDGYQGTGECKCFVNCNIEECLNPEFGGSGSGGSGGSGGGEEEGNERFAFNVILSVFIFASSAIFTFFMISGESFRYKTVSQENSQEREQEREQDNEPQHGSEQNQGGGQEPEPRREVSPRVLDFEETSHSPSMKSVDIESERVY